MKWKSKGIGKQSVPAFPEEAMTLRDEQLLDLADAATNLWRARKRLQGTGSENLAKELGKFLRPIDSAIAALERFGIRLIDHTGDHYDPGMALTVVSCQPQNDIDRPVVSETLKPTVYYKDLPIQHADVIVGEPIKKC